MTALERSPPPRAVALALGVVGIHSALVAADVLPRYDALAFVFVAVFFARTVAVAPPRMRLGATIAFFALFGAGVYANQLITGVEGRHALVGGIIPWSDAEGFLSNAWRAQLGLPFSTAITRTATRPLFPMTLSLTLAAAAGNVKVALGAWALATAALMGLVASNVGRRYGWRAMAVAILLFAFYLRRYLFVIGTESLGVVAGLGAFHMFFSAFEDGDGPRWGLLLPLAFFVLGVGLMARPGPLLALPLMLAWIYRRAARSERTKLTLACGGALALAMVVNAAVVRTTAEQSGTSGGEFPPILYGAMHGEDYTYLVQVHPEVANLPQAERIGATARLIASEIRARPWVALGFARGAVAFIGDPHGLFSLAFYDPDDAYFEGKAPLPQKLARMAERAGPYRIANLVAMAALAAIFVGGTLVGVVRRLRKKERDPLTELGAVVLAGAALSACLTPPWITEGAQLQATTLGLLAVLPWTSAAPNAGDPSPTRRAWLAPALLLGYLFVAFVYCVTRPRAPGASCTEGRAVRLEPSMLVEVRATGGYTLERLEENLRFVGKHNSDLTRPLVVAARPGLGIEMVYDACAERAGIVLGDAAALRARGRSWLTIKGPAVDRAGRIFPADP